MVPTAGRSSRLLDPDTVGTMELDVLPDVGGGFAAWQAANFTATELQKHRRFRLHARRRHKDVGVTEPRQVRARITEPKTPGVSRFAHGVDPERAADARTISF